MTALAIILLACTQIKAQPAMFFEGFEEGIIPDTWTVYDMNDDSRIWESDSRTAHSGNWCVGVSVNTDGTKNDWLITPLLAPTSENHTYSFWAKSQVPLPELLEDFRVMISTTGNNPDDFVELIGEETSIPATWNQYSYDLSNYIDQEIYVALINESFEKAVMFADDFTAPFFYFDNDLKITGISGETIPMIGESTDVTVTVENSGWADQQDYNVVLYAADGSQLNSVQGTALSSFEETDITLSWTPDQAIPTYIYARVVLDTDENPGNNLSKDWYVSVHPIDLVNINHGEFTDFEYSPLFFPAKTSLSESVYPATEINMMGTLTEIVYSANFQYEVREKNIRVWIGETDMEELDMEWIPSSQLTLVYDGKITVPCGEYQIPVRLDQPYIYTGGNLVIMIERSWDDNLYGYENEFHNTPCNKLRTIQYTNNFEPTDPEDPSLDIWWTISSAFTPDINLYFDVSGMGSLSGTITDIQQLPVEDALIEAEEINYRIHSDELGTYNIPYIFSGSYNFTVSKHGFYPAEKSTEIPENQAMTLDFEMTPIPAITVEGIVNGSDNPDGIAQAVVTLTGYDNYESETDDQGYFSLDGVYTDQTYQLTISANGYVDYQDEVEVSGDHLDLGTIVLNEVTPQPVQVTATDFGMMAGVSWIEPNGLPESEMRYDDGEIISQLGFEGDFPNAVMGAVHPANSIISSVSWFLTDEVDHEVVKIFIFGLDIMGKPDETNILFQSGEIPNTDNEWNELELPGYLDAPNGFFVGVCTPNQFTSIGIDDGMDAPYEFSFGTHYVVDDWVAGNEWVDIGDMGFFQNMMIRANGYTFGSKNTGNSDLQKIMPEGFPELLKTDATVKSPPHIFQTGQIRSLEHYQVFRLLKGDEENEENWTTLTDNFSSTFYEDFDWTSVDPGIYRYAVKAVYTGNLLSMPRFSNEITMEETADIQIEVTANSGDPVTGANLFWQSEAGYPGFSQSLIIPETGIVTLTSVPLDTYKVDISLDGFDDFFADNLVVNGDTSFVFGMTESFEPPFNPQVEVNGSDASALLTWNNVPEAIFEDFESLQNFSYDLGDWTSVDVDEMNTMYINEFDYPLNGEPMGFISFNPQATEPAMMDIYAYSGDRCAASVNADMAESDDWLISPKIDNVVDGTVFKFMARSSSDMWELEWFKVAVSVTGTNPEDFTTISEGDFLVAPYWNWQEFSFDLSEYAGQEIYVAIQHISVDGYILLIDDLFIGMPTKQSRSLTGYTVYLDGEEMGTTTEENFTFTDLEDGREYEAGIAANYSTGSSEIVTVNFTGQNLTSVSNADKLNTLVYPNPSNGVFNIKMKSGGESCITVYNATGQEVYKQTTFGQSATIYLPGGVTGLCWLQITHEGDTSIRKIIIN